MHLRFLWMCAGASWLASACSSSDPPSAPPTAAAQAPTDPGPASPADPAPPARTAPPNGSAGCGASSVVADGGQTKSITVKGAARTYVLSVPTGYDAWRAYPLVFVFHSGGGTGAGARDYFGFSSIAEDRAIFVYPDGKGGDWDLDTKTEDNDDIALFDALVGDLEGDACVDRTKVFATGSSMGAYFSNQLGCRRGDVLRAIAPHSGGGPYDVDSAYDENGHLRCAGKPVAAMVFHGASDTTVNVSEGQASVEHWAWANGCKSTTSDVAPSPCVAYDGCARPVVWCKLPGLGHRIWSDGPQATWDFFASM